MAKDNELIIKINGDIKNYQDALKAASKETESLQDALNTIAKTGAVAFAGFGASILFAAKQAGKFETIEAQFETLTGSVTEAQKVIKGLSDFTAKTPFQFPGVAAAGKQLLAFKVQNEELIPTLRRIGDVAAATGAPLKDLTLIFGQVKAAGKLTGERLLQLEERAIPIGPALAKTMGVAESSIRDLVSKGEIDFKTFEKAFASLSEKGGLAFEGMAKRSQTLEGRLSTMSDNFDLVVAAVGKNFIPVLKQATAALTNMLEFIRENPGLTDFIAKMLIAGTVTGGIVTTGALAITMFLKLRAAIVASTIATKGLSFAVKGLVGATGIGLLIAFLPEIIEGFKFAFDGAVAIVRGAGKKIKDIVLSIDKILFGVFNFDLSKIKEGLADFKKAFADAATGTAAEFKKIRKASDDAADTTKKNAEDATKTAKEEADKAAAINKKSLDKKAQSLKDENELIKAQLDGIKKEEIAFLKRRQEIRQKERDAQVIQDETRRKLAIENIKLLNAQLLKEEGELAKKRAKLEEQRTDKIIEQFAKEEEQAAAAESREEQREQRKAQRLSKEEAAAAERIQSLKDENAIILAEQEGLEQKEIEFLQRRQSLKAKEREARKIANTEERTKRRAFSRRVRIFHAPR
jgi:tape measure domain-containing protein